MRWREFLAGAALATGVVLCVVPRASVRAQESQDAQDQGAGPAEYMMQTTPFAPNGALIAVLNTRTEVLTVYEAQGGARSTRGIELVGARKLARDVYVTGYNDRSEYSYQDLVNRLLEVEKQQRQDSAAGKTSGGGKDH